MLDRAWLKNWPALLVLVSNIARAASQWILVWCYALLGGSSAVGEFSLALAIVTPIFIASEMSLRNVYVTLHREIAFTSYVLVRSVSTMFALGVAVAISGWSFVSMELVLLLALIKAADSVADLSYAALQKEGRLASIATSSIANSFLTVLVGVSAYWATRSIELSLLGSLLASVAVAGAVFVPVLRRRPGASTPGISTGGSYRGILHAGLPSGLAFASVSLLTYVPFYFLGLTAGIDQVGSFAVLAYFLVFANLFYASVQQSTLHSFVASFISHGKTGLLRYAVRIGWPLAWCGILSGTAVLFAGAPLIELLYGAEFTLTAGEVWPIAVALALLPLTYVSGAVLLTRNLYTVQFAIGLVSLLATVGIGVSQTEGFSLTTAGLLVLAGTTFRGVLGITAAAVVLAPRGPRRSPIENAT
ncbi:O-antigen/teichoic acid export membrane protein [Marisediminicola sp. UYEF4]|uniref:lipopolysaccharide biosynthesis protein n=1 Tax=Marisediminicola sp. UYEF4 TaxID=1756384 RepID=UPI003391F3F3